MSIRSARVDVAYAFRSGAPGQVWVKALVLARCSDVVDRRASVLIASFQLERWYRGYSGLHELGSLPERFAEALHIARRVKYDNQAAVSETDATIVVHAFKETVRALDPDSSRWDMEEETPTSFADIDWDAIAIEARSTSDADRVRAVFAAQAISEALVRALGYDKGRYPSLFVCMAAALADRHLACPKDLEEVIRKRNHIAHQVPSVRHAGSILAVAIHKLVFDLLTSHGVEQQRQAHRAPPRNPNATADTRPESRHGATSASNHGARIDINAPISRRAPPPERARNPEPMSVRETEDDGNGDTSASLFSLRLTAFACAAVATLIPLAVAGGLWVEERPLFSDLASEVFHGNPLKHFSDGVTRRKNNGDFFGLLIMGTLEGIVGFLHLALGLTAMLVAAILDSPLGPFVFLIASPFAFVAAYAVFYTKLRAYLVPRSDSDFS